MNIYTLILFLLSLGISTTHYGMESKVPPQYHNLDWKEAIHDIRENTALSMKEYNENINYILEYAADQYQWKTKRTLSVIERKQLKIKLLRDTIRDK